MASKRKAAVKSASVLGSQWVEISAESRWNPLRFLEPEVLVQYIESYECGNFAWMDRTMRAMERRDDTWKIAAAKARKDVARRKWECAPLDGYEDDLDAAKQAEVLKQFYSKIRAMDYDCHNTWSGMRGLIEGMMHAYNDGFTIHEIVFAPSPSGLTATVTRCPLEWFRLINGEMCLVAGGGQTTLEPGGWIIARGDGVGIACSIAYELKKLAIGDWAIYSGRCGQRGIHGKTSAQKGTAQWNDFVGALRKYGKQWACITGLDEVIETIDMSVANSSLPYPPLVERMDRAIAALQRGADLSTLSSGKSSEGRGGSLQGDETELICADNCEMVTEALRGNVDPVVLRWYFGDDVEVKAGVRVVPPQRDTIDRDLRIDDVLSRMGIKLSKRDALNRYGRREVALDDKDDAPLLPPAGLPTPPPRITLANELPDASDPLKPILASACAKILDTGLPLQDAIASALLEINRIPNLVGTVSPDAFQEKLESALFDAAAKASAKKPGVTK